MDKKLFFSILVILLFVIGCAPKPTVMKKPIMKEPETTEEYAQDIGQDVASLDDLQEDLDLTELESLDNDLAEIENLDLR